MANISKIKLAPNGAIYNLKDQYAYRGFLNIGSADDPCLSLDEIPLCSSGTVYFGAGLSPSGSSGQFTYWNSGTSENRYVIYAVDQYANQAYYQVCYGGTLQGWKKVIIEDDIVDSLVSSDTNKALSANQGRILNNKLAYELITDWNNFKPEVTSDPYKMYGRSAAGASNTPFDSTDTSFYGYVEGYSTYFTQHVTVQWSTDVNNRNRTFIRSYLPSSFTEWIELLPGSGKGFIDSCDLDNLIAPGIYGLSSTKTYDHIPSGFSSGILEVICPMINGAFAIQRLVLATKMAIRYRSISSGTSWGSWYKYTGEIIT